MKRILPLLLAVAMLASCSGNPATAPATAPATVPATTAPATLPPETDDYLGDPDDDLLPSNTYTGDTYVPKRDVAKPADWLPSFEVPAYTVPEANYEDLTSPKNTDLTFPKHNDAKENTIQQYLGFNHINIGYTFLERDALTEGGVMAKELGSRVIKVYLENAYRTRYKPNTNWGVYQPKSCMELAQHPFYQELFSMDFDTFVMGCYVFNNAWGNPAVYWEKTFPEAARQLEYKEMYELTYYLCKTYEGTGKTFIIQNWEGDWSCAAAGTNRKEPAQAVFDRMIQWTNTRQDAVMAARRDAGCEDVYVYHAIEVNLVQQAIEGKGTVTNNVIPYTYCDFYSYSAYDTIYDLNQYSKALDYLSNAVANNRTGGKSGVFVGELGSPENVAGYGYDFIMKNIPAAAQIAREKGYAHCLFWSLYEEEFQKNDKDFRGYWLIKGSGWVTDLWNLFYQWLNDGADSPRWLAFRESLKTQWPLKISHSTEGKRIRNGIALRPNGVGGEAELAKVDGVTATATKSDKKEGMNHLYLAVEEGLATAADTKVTVTLVYLDNGTDPFTFEYRKSDGTLGKVDVSRRDTDKWKFKVLTLTDAGFDGFSAELGENTKANIRLTDHGTKLYLRKILIEKE